MVKFGWKYLRFEKFESWIVFKINFLWIVMKGGNSFLLNWWEKNIVL